MLKKITSYLLYLDANNFYGWVMSQKLPINGFKWVEHLSKFNEKFIKSFNENSDREYFLEVDAEYPKNLFNSHKDLPFLAEKKKKNSNNLLVVQKTKKNMLFI